MQIWSGGVILLTFLHKKASAMSRPKSLADTISNDLVGVGWKRRWLAVFSDILLQRLDVLSVVEQRSIMLLVNIWNEIW